MSGEGLIRGSVQQEWRLVHVDAVIVTVRQREVDPEHVKKVLKSFTTLGGQLQLQPIVLDGNLVLIDGAHRLEAAKQAGWEFVSAMILDGVDTDERSLLELEANQVRKQLSPVEIMHAWTTHIKPAFQAKAKDRQLLGVAAMHEARGLDTDAIVHGNTVNNAEPEKVSIARVAKETTGMGIDWLNKMEDIALIAESESVPEPLRKAAQKGLEKLSKPHAKVDPVHKELLAIQEALARRSDSAEERQLRALEKTLDRMLSETTLMSERLGGQLGEDLQAASRTIPNGAESLRAVRVALTKSLAEVVAFECMLEPDLEQALSQYGREVTRSLSELSIARLGMEQVDERG